MRLPALGFWALKSTAKAGSLASDWKLVELLVPRIEQAVGRRQMEDSRAAVG